MSSTIYARGESVRSEDNTELVPASDPRAVVISIDPQRMGGTPCFAGTRVPVQSLWDHLAHGVGIDQFLEDFEGVPRGEVVQAIQMAGERLMEGLPAR